MLRAVWTRAQVQRLKESRLTIRGDFAVRAELEIDGDLEFGELKWRGEIVTLVVVNSFLQETPGRWSVDTEGNLRGVSKTRGDLCLKFNKCVAIFDDPVEVRQRFRSAKESSTKQSQNSNEVIMTLETPGRGEPCYNAPHCSLIFIKEIEKNHEAELVVLFQYLLKK